MSAGPIPLDGKPRSRATIIALAVVGLLMVASAGYFFVLPMFSGSAVVDAPVAMKVVKAAPSLAPSPSAKSGSTISSFEGVDSRNPFDPLIPPATAVSSPSPSGGSSPVSSASPSPTSNTVQLTGLTANGTSAAVRTLGFGGGSVSHNVVAGSTIGTTLKVVNIDAATGSVTLLYGDQTIVLSAAHSTAVLP